MVPPPAEVRLPANFSRSNQQVGHHYYHYMIIIIIFGAVLQVKPGGGRGLQDQTAALDPTLVQRVLKLKRVGVESCGCALRQTAPHRWGRGRRTRGRRRRLAPPPRPRPRPATWSTRRSTPDSPELSDALRHVQRRQHLLEDGSLHVGAAQVCLLQVAAGKVTVLQGRTRQTRLWFCWFSTDVVMR